MYTSLIIFFVTFLACLVVQSPAAASYVTSCNFPSLPWRQPVDCAHSLSIFEYGNEMWVEICLSFLALACLLVLWTGKGGGSLGNGLKKPPGPWRWPLLGNLPQLAGADAKYTHLAFAKLAAKYGDVMSVKFGVHDTVVLSSYEAIRDLMGRPELAGRYDGFPHTTDRSFGVAQGISFTSGELWRTSRRFTVRTLRDFGFGKRGSMSATVADELVAFCGTFEAAGAAANGGGFLVTIEPSLFSLSFVNILWSYVAGYRFSHSDGRLRRMLELNEKAFSYWNHSSLSMPFPFLRHVLPGQRDRQKTYNELHTFMKGLINETAANYRSESPGNPRNFIECFIQQIDSIIGNESKFFNFDQLNMILQDLFLGGSETTSSAMTHAILYMTLYPDVQAKVYTLVQQVAGQLTAGDLAKMPFVEATIHEIFRYAQLGPIMAARMCMNDVIYRDYLLPKGTPVFATLYSVMMDPEFWGDPETFRPERFLDHSGTKLVNLERMMPFGFGKRVCPAESMARESFFLLLAGLLIKYRFELPPGTEPPPSTQPMPLFILRPYPFQVLVRPRV